MILSGYQKYLKVHGTLGVKSALNFKILFGCKKYTKFWNACVLTLAMPQVVFSAASQNLSYPAWFPSFFWFSATAVSLRWGARKVTKECDFLCSRLFRLWVQRFSTSHGAAWLQASSNWLMHCCEGIIAFSISFTRPRQINKCQSRVIIVRWIW